MDQQLREGERVNYEVTQDIRSGKTRAANYGLKGAQRPTGTKQS